MRQRWLAVVPVIMGLAIGACDSPRTSPVAPSAPTVRADVRSSGYVVCGKKGCAKMLTAAGEATVSRTATIGDRGGTITVGDISLQVPGRAVDHPTAFTVVLKTQPYIAVELHALPEHSQTEIHTFNGKTLTLTLGYGRSQLDIPDPAKLRIYYVGDDGEVDEVLVPKVDARGHKLIVGIQHFSEYGPGLDEVDAASW